MPSISPPVKQDSFNYAHECVVHRMDMQGATKTAHFLRAQALRGNLKGQFVLVHDVPPYFTTALVCFFLPIYP